MTNAVNNSMTQGELERLLEVYGSDRTRWPVEARASAGQLVARDKAAARMLAEAEALDRVLERAPLPSLATEAALADRIVEAARRSPRMVRIGGEVPAAAPRRDADVISLPRSGAGRRWLGRQSIGGAAGVLAASLTIGVFIGLAGMPQGVLPALQEMTGIHLVGNSGYNLAQADPLDEDLL